MRKILVLYNPESGIRKSRRLAAVQSAVEIFRASGSEIFAEATHGRGSAGEQARRAIEKGCQTIIAAGGDGTLHDIVQGVAGAPPEIAVGMLPLGTGNILGHNLGIPSHNAAAAARMLLGATPKRIGLGKIEYSLPGEAEFAGSRFFLLNAGVGVDALSMYRATVAAKARLGEIAYYLSGIKLLFTYSFPDFTVEISPPGSPGSPQLVSQAAAFRIRTLGGLIGELAPEADLGGDDMQVISFKTRSRWRYLQYSLRTALRGSWTLPEVEWVAAKSVVCRASAGGGERSEKRIYAQADGEVLGGLPVRMQVVPNALTLLFPRTANKT